MQIDTHTHVVAPDHDRYPLSPREMTSEWYLDAPVSVDGLVELMNGAHVDRAVLVQAVSAYGFDNRYTLDGAQAHPDRCTSVACLDLGVPGAVADVEAVLSAGARGLRWWALADEPFDEPAGVWDVVATAGLPVVITMFASRLPELATLLPKLSRTPIVIDHCAFADLSRGVPDELRALAEFARVHLKVSTITLDHLAAHGDVRDGLAELVDCFGADHLMWGSDYSQTHDRPYGELAELGRQAASRLDDDARDRFLAGTALWLWPELAP